MSSEIILEDVNILIILLDYIIPFIKYFLHIQIKFYCH